MNVYIYGGKAHFKKNPDGKSIEYVVQLVNGKTHFVGEPKLTVWQENKYFDDLLKETMSAGPFDDLGLVGNAIHNAVSELEPELGLKKKNK